MTQTAINTSLLGADPSGSANLLDNAGFEIWQRGATFSTPANNAYTADRWKFGKGGAPTFTVSQDTTTFDTGTSSMSVNITVANGATDCAAHQALEGITSSTLLAGKTVTFSARVKASVANTVRAGISYSPPGTYAFSNYHSGSGNWETLSVTFTLPSNLSSFEPYVGILAGTVVVTQFWIDSCVFVVGSGATPTYTPLHPQQDLARCQRYYEANTAFQYAGADFAGSNTFTIPVTFQVQKRVTPTLSITNGTTVKLSSVGTQITPYGYSLSFTTTAGSGAWVLGSGNTASWTATADL